MFKKIFSLFTKQQNVGVNDIVIHPLTQTDDLFCDLVGDVTIIVDPKYSEPNLIMNICPGLLEQLNIEHDSVQLNKTLFRSVNEVDNGIIINNVRYPRPTFRIHIDNLSYLSLNGVAHYTLEYNNPEIDLELVTDGASQFQMNIHAKDVELILNAVGSTKGTIHAKEVNIEHEGVGSVVLEGSAQRGILTLDSVGKFNSSGLHIHNGAINISSVGDASVTIEDLQYANLDSIGNVTVYTSTPQKLKQKGLGDLKTREMLSSGMSFN